MIKEKSDGGPDRRGNRLTFYSRAKKPKLYNALAVTVLAAALVVLVRRFLPEYRVYAETIAIGAALVCVIAMFVVALKRQIEYNPYSYNTVIYFGFSLLLASVLLSHIRYSVLVLSSTSGSADGWTFDAISYFSESAKAFLFFSAPFILFFASALVISNIALVRREGGRLRNLIGSIFAILFTSGWAALMQVSRFYSGSETEVMIFEIVTNVFAVLILYCECMLIGAIFANIVTVRYRPEYDKDYVIILGCGIAPDGTPRPLLRGRIERAVAFCEEQYTATGKKARFVVSGGKGANEPISEAQSMKNYLLEKGIPESQIILEDRSTDTLENMRFSREKIMSFGDASAKVLFSTSNYHVFRSGVWSNRVKMKAVGVGAKTKWYFWPNASVREFIGLLSEHRGKQAFILIGLLAVYSALSAYSILH